MKKSTLQLQPDAVRLIGQMVEEEVKPNRLYDLRNLHALQTLVNSQGKLTATELAVAMGFPLDARLLSSKHLPELFAHGLIDKTRAAGRPYRWSIAPLAAELIIEMRDTRDRFMQLPKFQQALHGHQFIIKELKASCNKTMPMDAFDRNLSEAIVAKMYQEYLVGGKYRFKREFDSHAEIEMLDSVLDSLTSMGILEYGEEQFTLTSEFLIYVQTDAPLRPLPKARSNASEGNTPREVPVENARKHHGHGLMTELGLTTDTSHKDKVVEVDLDIQMLVVVKGHGLVSEDVRTVCKVARHLLKYHPDITIFHVNDFLKLTKEEVVRLVEYAETHSIIEKE